MSGRWKALGFATSLIAAFSTSARVAESVHRKEVAAKSHGCEYEWPLYSSRMASSPELPEMIKADLIVDQPQLL
jgi:hypothetical protein